MYKKKEKIQERIKEILIVVEDVYKNKPGKI